MLHCLSSPFWKTCAACYIFPQFKVVDHPPPSHSCLLAVPNEQNMRQKSPSAD